MKMKPWIVLLVSTLLAALGVAQVMSAAGGGTAVTYTSEQPAWECWNSGTMDPCQYNILSIEFNSASNGWAVTGGGTTLHWNGSAWIGYDTPLSKKDILWDVSIVDSDDAWAVGFNPFHSTQKTVLIHWDGAQWTRNNITHSILLQDVEMVSTDDGWAVGNGGILRWNGVDWNKVSNYSGLAVDMLTANDGWIYANSYNSSTLLHWDGITLTQVLTSTPIMHDIQMLATDNVWAVGEQNRIWHYDGINWTYESAPFGHGPIYDIHMLSATDGWAVGGDFTGGKVWHWDGVSWTRVTGGNSINYAVGMIASNQGWIGQQNGSMLAWDGIQWQAIPTPQTYVGSRLNDVRMLTENDGWTVSQSGGIVHWNGTDWVTVNTSNSYTLNVVEPVTHTDVWAGGVLTILHWDGNQWQAQDTNQFPAPYPKINDISAVSANDVWAVGRDEDAYQSLIWHWNGASWSSVPHTQTTQLLDVEMVSATDGWVAGAGGTLLHWDGFSWDSAPISGTIDYATNLSVISSADVWASASMNSQAIFLHWDGIIWTPVSAPVSSIVAIDMISTDLGWAIDYENGDYFFMKWDGFDWKAVGSSPSNTHLYAIDMVSDVSGWAVGKGPILRYSAPVVLDKFVYLPVIVKP